jgi:hypothetical protein
MELTQSLMVLTCPRPMQRHGRVYAVPHRHIQNPITWRVELRPMPTTRCAVCRLHWSRQEPPCCGYLLIVQ